MIDRKSAIREVERLAKKHKLEVRVTDPSEAQRVRASDIYTKLVREQRDHGWIMSVLRELRMLDEAELERWIQHRLDREQVLEKLDRFVRYG